MPYFVYILECSDKTYYCGYTVNLDKRLFAHNNSKNGSKYTYARRPVKLIYSETFETLSDALKREMKIKKLSRNEKAVLISKNSIC
jgi:putative endonuclease